MSNIPIEDGPDQTPLAAYQVYLLQARTARSLQFAVRSSLTDLDVTLPQWLLLSAVRDIGRQEVSMQALALVLGVSLPRTTALARTLIHKKLLQQKLAKHDLRQRQLVCTAAGRRLLRKCNDRITETLQNWRRPLTEDQIALYARLLTKLSK